MSKILATDEQIRDLAEWLCDEYDELSVEQEIERIREKPDDVGVVFTTCFLYDERTRRYCDQFWVQFSYDLTTMSWHLYLNQDEIGIGDLSEDKWGWIAGMDYDMLCGDLFDLCNQFAPVDDCVYE